MLRRLERGPRTRAQLAEACVRRGVPSWATEQVLDRFTELGLVDDEAFAAAWVDSRHAGRGLARRALRHELTSRGVDRDTVDEALQRVDADDERAAAAALVQARLPALARVDHATRVRRLQGLLGRRGYSAGLSMAVIAEVLADHGGDAADAVARAAEGDLGP